MEESQPDPSTKFFATASMECGKLAVGALVPRSFRGKSLEVQGAEPLPREGNSRLCTLVLQGVIQVPP